MRISIVKSYKSFKKINHYEKNKHFFLCDLIFAVNIGVYAQNALTWNITSETLIITGWGAIPNYSTSGTNVSPWISSTSFTKVVIGSGVTSIGSNAFYNCSI